MSKSYPIVSKSMAGRYYVDESCIYCQLCVDSFPSLFAYDEEDGVAYIRKQASNHIEHESMLEVIKNCPTESIGDKLHRHEEVIDDMGLGLGSTPKSLGGGFFQLVMRLLSRKK